MLYMLIEADVPKGWSKTEREVVLYHVHKYEDPDTRYTLASTSYVGCYDELSRVYEFITKYMRGTILNIVSLEDEVK